MNAPRQTLTLAVLTNWEIVVYALYLEGGATDRVHTEDLALRCFGLAQDSFSWVKHRNYPDKDIVRVALTDARKPKHGALVSGRAGRTTAQSVETTSIKFPDGWQLTRSGVAWIQENEERLQHALNVRAVKPHRQDILRSLERVRKHPLFLEYQSDPGSFTPRIGDLAEMLRCRVDAEQFVWNKRFESLYNQAELAHQKDLVAFLDRCQGFQKSQV